MSDPLQGWLDIAPARKDTAYGSNDKWDRVVIARGIKKLNTLIHIPAFNVGQVPAGIPSFIGMQLNYTASQPFTLVENPFAELNLALQQSDSQLFGMVCIRYRIGGASFRRKLFDPPGNSFLYTPYYNGEIILPNFVLEFWTQSRFPQHTIGLYNREDFYLKTSILNVPSNAYDTSPILESASGIFTDLYVQLPQNLPINWNANALWLSN